VEQEALLVVTSRMALGCWLSIWKNQRSTVQPGGVNSLVTGRLSGEGFYYAPDPPARLVCRSAANVAETPVGCIASKRRHQQPRARAEWSCPDGQSTRLAVRWRRCRTGFAWVCSSAAKAPRHCHGHHPAAAAPTADVEVLLPIQCDWSAREAVAQCHAAAFVAGWMEIMDNFTINAVRSDLFGTTNTPRDAAACC